MANTTKTSSSKTSSSPKKTTKTTRSKTTGSKDSVSKPAISKTKRILTYLEKNPGHTWSNAKAKLEKYGISNTYFSMIKSKNNGKSTTGPSQKPNGKKTATTKSGNVKQLQKAAEFAKSVGGIDNAKAALSQLEQFQVS